MPPVGVPGGRLGVQICQECWPKAGSTDRTMRGRNPGRGSRREAAGRGGVDPFTPGKMGSLGSLREGEAVVPAGLRTRASRAPAQLIGWVGTPATRATASPAHPAFQQQI